MHGFQSFLYRTMRFVSEPLCDFLLGVSLLLHIVNLTISAVQRIRENIPDLLVLFLRVLIRACEETFCAFDAGRLVRRHRAEKERRTKFGFTVCPFVIISNPIVASGQQRKRKKFILTLNNSR